MFLNRNTELLPDSNTHSSGNRLLISLIPERAKVISLTIFTGGVCLFFSLNDQTTVPRNKFTCVSLGKVLQGHHRGLYESYFCSKPNNIKKFQFFFVLHHLTQVKAQISSIFFNTRPLFNTAPPLVHEQFRKTLVKTGTLTTRKKKYE